ncbi:MAG: hypothetical protein HY901_32935 [Deltaproteobacteria bacterium]|nr:hypothetical protein [Deltaproteobacteria bacterium]
MKPRSRAKHRKDFERFCGIWSKAQVAQFEKSIASPPTPSNRAQRW